MWKLFRRWRLAERGFSTAALTILAMPLILGAIGYAFDTARISFIRQKLNGFAQMSAQGAINQATMNTSGQLIVTNLGSTMSSIYCANTAYLRPDVLTSACSITPSQFGSALSNTDYCLSAWTKVSPTTWVPNSSYRDYGIKMVTKETTDTAFLKLLGPSLKTITITNIEGIAILRARNC